MVRMGASGYNFERSGASGGVSFLSVVGLTSILFLLPIGIRLPTEALAGKLTVLEPVTGITLIIWFSLLCMSGRIVRLNPRIYVPLMLFLAAGCLSIFGARDPSASLAELLAYANGGLLLFLMHQIAARERTALFAISFLFLGAAVALGASVIGMTAIFGGMSLPGLISGAGKLTATFRTSSQLPSYMIVLLPLLLSVVVRRGEPFVRLLALLGAMVAGLSIMASGSRSGLLAALVSGVMYLFWRSRRRVRFVFVAGIAALLFFFAWRNGLFGNVPGPIMRSFSVFEDIADIRMLGNGSEQVRIGNIQAWLQIARTHPLLGVGLGNFKLVLTELVPQLSRGYELHNSFLSIWAETGILGFLAFLLFLAPFVSIGLRSIRRLPSSSVEEYRAALTFGIAGNLFHQFFHMGLRQPIFWVGLGLLLALDQVARHPEGRGLGSIEIKGRV